MEDKFIMSQKEISRMTVLSKVLEGKMKQTEASLQLDISARHINRIIKEARKTSLALALINKKRGTESHRKLSLYAEKYIVNLYEGLYHDFSIAFFKEKLEDEHKIYLGRESIRKILLKYNLRKPRRKNRGYCHTWRERKHYEGELVQVDGSHHLWLEDRYPNKLCLMGYIDDATGRVFGRFYDHEGTKPGLDSLKRFVLLNGLPKALYLDRHSTYMTTRHASIEEELKNTKAKTQFERASHELGIKIIHARSPQAKGRVERLFATLQDRLVKELRLNDICNLEQANIFLEKYFIKFNSQFSITPKESASFFQTVPYHINLEWICSIKDNRGIGSDYTIRWRNRLFLLLNPALRLKRKRIEIREDLNSKLTFIYKDTILRVKEITDKDIKRAHDNKVKLKSIARSWKHNEEKFKDSKYVELSMAR